jgi:hypothetical protein
MTTSKPASARATAAARPIPVAAPVTNATFLPCTMYFSYPVLYDIMISG